jgi:general secretion pathway protein C
MLPTMKLKSLPTPELWLAILPKAASFLIVIGIAFAVTQIVWLFLLAPTPAEASVDIPMSTASKPAEDYAKRIEELHLFGISDKVPDDLLSAPETQLNLVLIGILAMGTENGMAIIGSGNDEKVYAIGANVPGNATLKAVYADRVILESSRGLETLRLPRDKNLFSFDGGDSSPGAHSDYVDPSRDPDYETPSEEDQPDEEPPDYAPSSDAGGASSHSFAEYRREFIRNPAALYEFAKIEPGQVNGEFKGYKLTLLKDDPRFDSLDLQRDDIITAINGIELNRPENGIKALRMLMKADNVEATILRNGQQINRSISLN